MEKIIKSPILPKFKKDYINKWVALSKDYKRVIAVGDSLREVLNKTSESKEKVVMKVLPPLGYAPICK